MMDTSDAPAERQRRTWLVVGGAVAAVVLIVIGVTLIVSLSEESPTDATERYLKAARDRNTAGARAAVCTTDTSATRTLLGIVDDSDRLIEWRIINEKVTGERAEVNATLTFANEGRTGTSAGTFTLVREHGDWRVCAVRRAGGPDN